MTPAAARLAAWIDTSAGYKRIVAVDDTAVSDLRRVLAEYDVMLVASKKLSAIWWQLDVTVEHVEAMEQLRAAIARAEAE